NTGFQPVPSEKPWERTLNWGVPSGGNGARTGWKPVSRGNGRRGESFSRRVLAEQPGVGLGRRAPAEAEVFVGKLRRQAALAGAGHERVLQQVGLDHVLQCV